MTKSIKLFANYVSGPNETNFNLWRSVFDLQSSVVDDASMVFYLDYNPCEDFKNGLNKLPNEALQHIRRHRSKILVKTEGFDIFGQLPEIFEHNNNIDVLPYWSMVTALADKGIAEDQLHIVSSNFGYDDEIKMLASRKIRWRGAPYVVKAKFLYLNDFINRYKDSNDHEKDPSALKYLYCSLANGRPTIHRYNFTKKLFDHGLQKYGKISLVKMDGPDTEFNKSLPLVYDGKHNQWIGQNDETHLFHDNLIWISNETFLNQKNIRGYTEKTIKAIYNKSPFMINGCGRLLELLKHDGFKTFDEVWDESYDQMPDIEDRQNCIIKSLQDLRDKSYEDLYQRTLPVVMHNYNHLMSIDPKQILHNFLHR